MKLGLLVSDVLGSLLRRPATRGYPGERPPPQPRLRGRVRWDPEHCTGCRLCVMDCPANALELFTLDKASHRFVLRYDAGQCTFCAQCARSCNYGAISLSSDEWELADDDKKSFVFHYGAANDVKQVLDTSTDSADRRAGDA